MGESHESNPYLVAERMGSLITAVTNLSARIDGMKDDHREAFENVRGEIREFKVAQTQLLSALEDRIDTIEDIIHNPDPDKHLTIPELMNYRARAARASQEWQQRLVVLTAFSSPVVGFILYKVFG